MLSRSEITRLLGTVVLALVLGTVLSAVADAAPKWRNCGAHRYVGREGAPTATFRYRVLRRTTSCSLAMSLRRRLEYVNYQPDPRPRVYSAVTHRHYVLRLASLRPGRWVYAGGRGARIVITF